MGPPDGGQLEYDSEQLSRLGITLGDAGCHQPPLRERISGYLFYRKGPDDKEWIRGYVHLLKRKRSLSWMPSNWETGDGTVVTLDKLIK